MLFFTDFGSGARLRICECCFRRLHVFHHLKGKIRTIRHLCYSNFSPYFFINILYGYVRLALVNVLLVRTLAVWHMKREGKKADRDTAETRRILHIIQVSCFTIAVYINQSPRDIFAKTAYLQKWPNDVIYEREQMLKTKMFTFIFNKFNHKTQGRRVEKVRK